MVCYERADDIGFGVSGVVTRARGIRATLPDLDPSRDSHGRAGHARRRWSICSIPPAPAAARARCARPTGCCALLGLPANTAFELPYVPPFLHKHGGLVMSLGQFMQFVGSELMASGTVQIWPGMPVESALVEDGRVCGVRLCDQGVDRQATRRPASCPAWMSARL